MVFMIRLKDCKDRYFEGRYTDNYIFSTKERGLKVGVFSDAVKVCETLHNAGYDVVLEMEDYT